MKSRLAVNALDNAVAARAAQGMTVTWCIVHADRGSQFRSRKFVAALHRNGLRGSMGRVATCADNAAIESFWALLQPARRSGPGGHGMRARFHEWSWVASFLGENLDVHTDNPGIPGYPGALWGWGVRSFFALWRFRGGVRAWPYARGDDPLVTHPRLDAALGPHDAAVPQRTFDTLLDEQGLHPLAVDVQLDVPITRRDPTRKLPRAFVGVFGDAGAYPDRCDVPVLAIHPASHRSIVARGADNGSRGSVPATPRTRRAAHQGGVSGSPRRGWRDVLARV